MPQTSAGSFSRRVFDAFRVEQLLHPLRLARRTLACRSRSRRPRFIDALPDPVADHPTGAQKLGKILRDAGCNTVVCRNAAEGMGVSLAEGVRAARMPTAGWSRSPNMPYLRPDTIRVIAKALSEGAADRGTRLSRRARAPGRLCTALPGRAYGLPATRRSRADQATPRLDHPVRRRRSGVLRDVDEPSDLEG